MSGNCFLDTNIFVYSVDRTDTRKAGIALGLIKQHAGQRTGVVSVQVIQEFFNLALKRFPTIMNVDDSRLYLHTVFQPLLSVFGSLALCGEAISLQSRFKISWYDSLIVAAASEARCSILYSEDMQHGMRFNNVRVDNPFLRN